MDARARLAKVAAGALFGVVIACASSPPDRGTSRPGTIVVGASRPLGVRF